jgi:hypothetical protein
MCAGGYIFVSPRNRDRSFDSVGSVPLRKFYNFKNEGNTGRVEEGVRTSGEPDQQTGKLDRQTGEHVHPNSHFTGKN